MATTKYVIAKADYVEKAVCMTHKNQSKTIVENISFSMVTICYRYSFDVFTFKDEISY